MSPGEAHDRCQKSSRSRGEIRFQGQRQEQLRDEDWTKSSSDHMKQETKGEFMSPHGSDRSMWGGVHRECMQQLKILFNHTAFGRARSQIRSRDESLQFCHVEHKGSKGGPCLACLAMLGVDRSADSAAVDCERRSRTYVTSSSLNDILTCS